MGLLLELLYLSILYCSLSPLSSRMDVTSQVSLDPDHKFDLALELGQLEDARKLLDDMPKEEYDTTDAQTKWKRLGDLALTKCD